MPTTNERRMAARRTDQEIKDEQVAQVDADRDERAKKLKIGPYTDK